MSKKFEKFKSFEYLLINSQQKKIYITISIYQPFTLWSSSNSPSDISSKSKLSNPSSPSCCSWDWSGLFSSEEFGS